MEPPGCLLVNRVAANADRLVSSKAMIPPPVVFAIPVIGTIWRLTPTTTSLAALTVLAIIPITLRVRLLVPVVVTPRIPHDIEGVAFGAALRVLDLNHGCAPVTRILN